MRRVLPVAFAFVSLVAAAGPARAANIALFFNPAYVDTTTGGTGEAYNLQQQLILEGHTVTTFTDISAEALKNTLLGKQVLVIPELQNSNLSPDLTQEARLIIALFVSGGGTLIVFDPGVGDPLAVLNGVFLYNLTSAGPAVGTISKTAEAATTPFASGPATLPLNLNAVDTVLAASLPGPPSSKVIYADSNGNAVVALITYGVGSIVILGWDWFDAEPVGAQDGGWLEVFNAAANISQTQPIPTLSEWAMIAMAALLIVVGVATLRRSRRLAI